jgi:hypothetical protein
VISTPGIHCLIFSVRSLCNIFTTLQVQRAVGGLWQCGLWGFQAGDTKLERFLPKNQHTRRKLLNLEFWINGELLILMQKPF